MIVVAALWIDRAAAGRRLRARPRADRARSSAISTSSSNTSSTRMIAASEIGPDGEVRFNRPPADQRFLEPYSGVYFQISGDGRRHLPVALAVGPPPAGPGPAQRRQAHLYDSHEFAGRAAAGRRARRHPARIERPLAVPGRPVARDDRRRRSATSARPCSGASPALGLGLLMLAALQTFYGLWPLRRVRREVAAIRSGAKTRITRGFPERGPAADRGDQPAARPQRGAGRGGAPPRRQSRPCAEDAADRDHQRRDRARAGPRRHRLPRGDGDAPPGRPPSRARPRDRPARLGPCPRDGLGKRRGGRSARSTGSTRTSPSTSPATSEAQVRVERQDLDEMLGNLVENAAKYGGGRVFVTVEPQRQDRRHPGRGRRPGHSGGSEREAIFHARRAARHTASPAPASASPSSATSPRSTAAGSARGKRGPRRAARPR